MTDIEPQPDPQAARAHLERLFRRARLEYPEGRAEIAWSDAKGAVNQAETFNLSPEGLDAATATAVRYNTARRNVYVGINPRKSTAPPFGRASATDVDIAFMAFIDGDSLETAQKLRAAPLPYTWAVTTGKTPNPRPQAYWELDEPIRNLAVWSQQQLALAEFFGADHVIDPPRIMRLAGTVNYPSTKKAARGYVVEQVTLRTLYDGEERDPVALEALTHAYPPVAPNGHAYTNGHANGHAASGFDHDTGEVFKEAAARPNFNADRVDPQIYVDAIKAGQNLHNNARQLIDHLVSTGRPNWLIREFLIALLKPVSDGGTIGQIAEMIRTWRQKTNIPDPDEDFSAEVPPPPDADVCSIASWLARDIPQPDFLLGELFSTTSRGMMVAPTGLGKTNFGLALAFAMSAGRPFLHWSGRRPARILFVEGEMSKRLVKARIADAVRRSGIIPDTLYVLSRDAIENLPPLNTVAGQKFIDAFIENVGGIDFAFFDNVQALLEGDMKDEVPWQATLPWIRDLTHRNIGQLWLHHTGHNETQSYGTKTREWQLDTVMLMEKVERSETDISFNLTFTKARERAPDNRANFEPVVITLTSDEWASEGGSVRRSAPSPLGLKFYHALLDALAISDTVERFAGRRAVTNEQWKLECVRLGLMVSGDAKSNQSLFNKYRRELIACDQIACNNDMVWTVS